MIAFIKAFMVIFLFIALFYILRILFQDADSFSERVVSALLILLIIILIAIS